MGLVLGTRLGPYEVVSPLGAGGMGEVYRARDTKLDRDVALKVFPEGFARDPERLARFKREAQVLASLNHPHIAQIYGVEDSGSTHALVLELVEGPTLADRIARGPLPLDEALAIAKQIADALETAHEQGIIHRDLKPANIKVRDDGTVKVLDFGLAKAIDPASALRPDLTNSPTLPSPAMVTGAGVLLGTAAYMAPEQAKGRPVDKRSDVWAFGAVLFEMMTGTRAFEGDSVSETLACVIEREPAWKKLPAKLSPTVRTCLERCLQKDPRQRIRDIGDVRLALQGAFESSVQPEQRSAITPSRGAVWIAFFLAALAAAGLAVAKWWDVPGNAAARNIVTFTIPPPPNTFFREVTISPDGSHVVFSVADRVGKRALWSRRLESLDLEPLAGTEGAQLPFWSPDNRFIGFNVGARLFKFDLARGSVQLAGNTGGVNGAAWRRDGSILFGQNLGGLYQLRPDSTNAQAVTTLDATHKETRHYWPVILPDNRHFLFVVASALPDVQGIWVASMDNPSDRHRVLSDLAMPVFSAGHLFFVRGDTLMAQPFDPVRSAFGAEAVPVLDHVTHQANTGYGAFSIAANGSVIALSQIRPWRLTWYDRAGRSLGVFGRGGQYRSLTLSPDEQRVAVDGDSDTAPGYQLFVIDHQRDTTTQLTIGESTGNFPTWSPDGRQLAFGSNRDGVYNIYLKPSSGAGQETSLVRNDQNKFVMDWSRDGRFLLYGERRPGDNRVDLWTLDMTGKRMPTLYLRGAGDQRYGRFSPDGRWVAYQSDESSRPEVYVQSVPSGADKVQISVNGGMHPVWRADGTELYYLTQSGMLMAVPVKPGTNFRVGVPVPLFQTWNDSVQNEFAVTRDGRFIFLAPEDNAMERPATMILNWH